jgi:DNA sulfur modification protein DndE
MKPPVDPVRVSARGREQLIKLKRQTGIEHWNVLCRWALCCSLREPSVPLKETLKVEGGVEIAWKVFGGEIADSLAAVMYQRAQEDGFGEDLDAVSACFRSHLERGLNYLSSEQDARSIEDFLLRWLRPIAFM